MLKQIEFIIFWIVILGVIVLSVNHNRFKIKTQKYIIFILVLVFSFLYSYRTLGMDLRNYESFFSSTTINVLERRLSIENWLSNEYEPFFLLVTYISKILGLSFNQWLLVIVLCPSLVFFYYIKKTEFPLITYLIFMLLMMFHFDLTRLLLAMPFLLVGITTKRKYVKIICYILAFGFHYSSLFVLICELITTIKWNKRRYMFFFITVLVVGFVLRSIDLSELQSSNFRFLFKLQHYLRGSFSFKNRNFVMNILLILINVYPICMCTYLLKKLQKNMVILTQDKLFINKTMSLIKIGTYTNIVMIVLFGGFQSGFRLLLITYFILFIPLSNIVGNNVKNGIVRGDAIGILLSILLYDVFMSIYYIGISIYY